MYMHTCGHRATGNDTPTCIGPGTTGGDTHPHRGTGSYTDVDEATGLGAVIRLPHGAAGSDIDACMGTWVAT